MNKRIPGRTYISIKAFLTENMVSFKEVWARNEFERFFVSFSTVRLKCEVNFFIREFLEIFYFPSAFILIKCLKRDFSFDKVQF